MIRKSLIAAVAVLCFATVASAETYNIDANHSYVGFSVRHLAISKVKGSFTDFEGTLEVDPADTSAWSCDITIQMNSIDTRSEGRDKHLRSEDFFSVEEFPTMTFKSTKVSSKGGGKLAIEGNLTMRGVTKPVTLDAEILGFIDDPWGNKRAGFTATTTIDRMDYDVSWNNTLETGGFVVGHDVDVSIEIEAVMPKEEDASE